MGLAKCRPDLDKLGVQRLIVMRFKEGRSVRALAKAYRTTQGRIERIIREWF